MKNGEKIFKRLFGWLVYKQKPVLKEFYIPEVEPIDDEISEASSNNNKDDENKTSNKEEVKKNSKGFIIPKTVEEIKKAETESQNTDNKADEKVNEKINEDYDITLNQFKEIFNVDINKDFVIREFKIGGKIRAFLVFIDGMADRTTINNFILRPLMNYKLDSEKENNCISDIALVESLEINQAKKSENIDDVIYDVLLGDTVIYAGGCNFFLLCETKGYDKRSVSKPIIEGAVKGSQEAFTENLRTNIALIRRNMKNKDLTTEIMKIGSRTNNMCAVVYLKGVVNPDIVKEVKRRLASISADMGMGNGIVEQFIEDSPWSLVPTTLSTERPDRAAAHLLEGRVAIMCEGTPFSLIVPITINTLLQTPEDTNLRWQYGTTLRLIRIFAVFVAVLLPGLYIALTNFHREMIPTDLLIAIAKARENVPFPTIVEVLLMEVSFELIREAGVRVPGIIGNTIGIIGALILGQAAVQANLVSPVLIIIIAFTGLGNFAIPDYSLAQGIRLYRLIFIFLGAFLGFYGIALGIVTIFAILVNTKSFGLPMFAPIAPKASTSKDIFVRHAIWKQEYRPDGLNTIDVRRQSQISRKWTVEDAGVPDRNNSENIDKEDTSNND